MCGLSGLAGDILPKFDAVFKDMLLFMSVRGQDSTGVGAVPKHRDQEVKWVKCLGGSWQLMDLKSFDKLMQGWHSCLLGHNRSTTIGSTNLKNAHPFYHSGEFSKNGILGIHNGTIDSQAKHRLKDHANFSTDSEAIIFNIAHEGPEETIKKLQGSYTLVWYDKTAHTINMIRNEKRPLSFCFSKDNKTLIFGSELPLLKAAVQRNMIEVESYFSLKEDLLLSWKIPENSEAFTPPEEKKIEGYKPTFTTDHTHSYFSETDYYDDHWQDAYQKNTAEQIRSKFTGEAKSGTTNFPVPGVYPPKNYPVVTTSPRKNSTTTLPKIPHSAFRGIRLKGPFAGLASYGCLPNKIGVFRDPKINQWVLVKYDNGANEWIRTYSKIAPPQLAYSMLDVNSNHSFKHIGKKASKRIFFLGFDRSQLLTKDQVEYFFSFGCMSCSRQPEWGNEVHWLNKDHDFLCEFCSLDSQLVNSWSIVA